MPSAWSRRARHIEVQIVGDGKGGSWRWASANARLQRRSQKLVEIAPSPDLAPALREKIVDAARAHGQAP